MFNLIVVDIVFGAATYHIRAWRGFSCGYDIPSFPTVLLHLAVFLVVEEILFYYAHRLVSVTSINTYAIICWPVEPMNIITYPLLQAATPPKALQIHPQEAP